MNINSFVDGVGDAFRDFFFPSQSSAAINQEDPVEQLDPSAAEHVEPQELHSEASLPKHEDIPEHPTTGVTQSLLNLATLSNHRSTAQALNSHRVVHEKTALMNKHLQHQELLRGIHENSEKNVYDFSKDKQILDCLDFLKQQGIEIPEGKTLSKNQCLTLHRKVEALYKNTESEQKIALNTFHEHGQLRDRIFEILKSCTDMIRSAIQKISGHIGR